MLCSPASLLQSMMPLWQAREAADPYNGSSLLPLPMAHGTGQLRQSQWWRMFFGILNFILSILKWHSGVLQICKCNIIVRKKIHIQLYIHFHLCINRWRRNSWQKYNVDVILKGQRKITLTPFSLSSRSWKPLNTILSPYHLQQCNSSKFWLTMLHSTQWNSQCFSILTKRALLKALKPISLTFPCL